LISCGKLESITNFHSPTQKVKEAVKINSILEGCLLQRLNYKHKVRRQATNFDEKVGCCYLLVSDGGRVEQMLFLLISRPHLVILYSPIIAGFDTPSAIASGYSTSGFF